MSLGRSVGGGGGSGSDGDGGVSAEGVEVAARAVMELISKSVHGTPVASRSVSRAASRAGSRSVSHAPSRGASRGGTPERRRSSVDRGGGGSVFGGSDGGGQQQQRQFPDGDWTDDDDDDRLRRNLEPASPARSKSVSAFAGSRARPTPSSKQHARLYSDGPWSACNSTARAYASAARACSPRSSSASPNSNSRAAAARAIAEPVASRAQTRENRKEALPRMRGAGVGRRGGVLTSQAPKPGSEAGSEEANAGGFNRLFYPVVIDQIF